MPVAPRVDPADVLEALASRPDGAAVLALPRARAAVVGGFVRDSLLARRPREIDIVVEGDAGAYAAALGGTITRHAAFDTARVERDGWTIDVASARSERYPAPGALPLVAPASLTDDLARRDFSVNTLAVRLDSGELRCVDGALEDLAARRLRVLHARSFVDDPTRLMRLARYRSRLGFDVEPHTAELARAARLDGVSGARIGAELRLALLEPDPLAPLADLAGTLPLSIDRELISRALSLAPADARRDLVILAAATREHAPERWIASLELTAAERDVLLAARRAQEIADVVDAVAAPSELRSALRDVPAEVVAIVGALGPAAAVRDWLDRLRHVRLEIDGDDLLAAGIAAGPQIGARLERTLRRKLDGELAAGREHELASALEVRG